MWWLLPASAQAADLAVPDDFPTLADAVAASSSGDVVLVDGRLGWVRADATLVVPHALTIRGVGGSRPVLTGGGVGGPLFRVDGAAAALVLQDVALTGEGEHRAVEVLQGDLTLRAVVTYDHAAEGAGGAILAQDGAGEILVEDSELSLGSATTTGGLIAMVGGSLTVRGSTLSAGTAGSDGGILWAGGDALLVEDSTFELGWSGGVGGAARIVEGVVDPRIVRSRFLDDTADGGRGGGAIYAEKVALTVEDSWYVGNEALGSEGGGALYLRGPGYEHQLTRVVLCDNAATLTGGALRVHDGTAKVDNGVFIGNSAAVAGASWVGSNATLFWTHVSAVTSTAGPSTAQAGFSSGTFEVRDSYVADHAVDATVIVGNGGGDAETFDTVFARNVGLATNFALGTAEVVVDPGVAVPALRCEPLELEPLVGSVLLGRAGDGTAAGAFGGDTWADDDADGVLSLYDCADDDASVFPGQTELPADGVDSDCDGFELCWLDRDGDGVGEDALVSSLDLGCTGPGEAEVAGDVCPGWPDGEDIDDDGIPDGCDQCPAGIDTDADGICDTDDVCPGFDDQADADGDGVPDGCEEVGPTTTGDPPVVDRGGPPTVAGRQHPRLRLRHGRRRRLGRGAGGARGAAAAPSTRYVPRMSDAAPPGRVYIHPRLPDERVRRGQDARAARARRVVVDRLPRRRRPHRGQHLLGAREGRRQDALRAGRVPAAQARGQAVLLAVAGCVAQERGDELLRKYKDDRPRPSGPTACRPSGAWSRRRAAGGVCSTPSSSTSRPTRSCRSSTRRPRASRRS
ncbi:MAG: MopE-related protein [Myxococcota bacterium]